MKQVSKNIMYDKAPESLILKIKETGKEFKRLSIFKRAIDMELWPLIKENNSFDIMTKLKQYSDSYIRGFNRRLMFFETNLNLIKDQIKSGLSEMKMPHTYDEYVYILHETNSLLTAYFFQLIKYEKFKDKYNNKCYKKEYKRHEIEGKSLSTNIDNLHHIKDHNFKEQLDKFIEKFSTEKYKINNTFIILHETNITR